MAEKQHDEYELVPMSPIRRLEKRIEQVENNPGIDSRDMFKEIIDIVRMNQQIVDEMAKANDALRIEISKLPGRLDQLIGSLNELLTYIKASAAEEMTAPAQASLQPLMAKFDQMIETNKKIAETNQSVVTTLGELENKLRKPVLPLARRPMMQQQQRPLPL